MTFRDPTGIACVDWEKFDNMVPCTTYNKPLRTSISLPAKMNEYMSQHTSERKSAQAVTNGRVGWHELLSSLQEDDTEDQESDDFIVSTI